MNASKIKFAERVARFMHMNQRDKAGVPYIFHVRSVAEAVAAKYPDNDVALISAWLHDTVEDTTLTIDAIRGEFGAEVAEVVHLLTRKAGQSSTDYYRGIAGNRNALIVKLADIFDNRKSHRMKLLPNDVQTRLTTKYDSALKYLNEQSIESGTYWTD